MQKVNIDFLRGKTNEWREFQLLEFFEKKKDALIGFFNRSNITATVVGVSGGIDSALVLALLDSVAHDSRSVMKHVFPVTMPIYNEGMSDVKESDELASRLITDFGHPLVRMELSQQANRLVDCLEMHDLSCEKPYEAPSDWTRGQLSCIVRTPMLYGYAAYLQQKGYKSIVVGTTNRDEGAYLGFFGKASDAMVDLQPIADMHKDEVYQLATHLGVPSYISGIPPKGNVWNSQTDEEMIGAPYWAIKLFILLKEKYMDLSFFDMDDEDELEELERYFNNIEKLHMQNAHKYQVGNPAHFVDVMPRKVPSGWQ